MIKKRIVIFGTGEAGRQLYSLLSGYFTVVAFADNNQNKHGMDIDEIQILSADSLNTINFDYIFVGSMYLDEISAQLVNLGLKDKLYHTNWLQNCEPLRLRNSILLYLLNLTTNKEELRSDIWQYVDCNFCFDSGSIVHTPNDILFEFLDLTFKMIPNDFTRNEILSRLNFSVWAENIALAEISEELLKRYLSLTTALPDYDFVKELADMSMLSGDVLNLLRLFALLNKGLILEIGPYIGGSTIAMAHLLKKKDLPALLSIEPGGVDIKHPHIPSDDIIRDLTANIQSYDVQDQVDLIQGLSCDQQVLETIRDRANQRGGIGLLFIDADGYVGRDFANLRSSLRDDCIIVFDDYISPGAPQKAELTKAWVDEQVSRGLLKTIAVFPWGTWFGKLNVVAQT